MKHFLFTFFLFIFCSIFLHGQENILINTKHELNSSEKTNEILRKSETYTSVDFVDINLDKIIDHEYFLLNLGERNISVRKERIDIRGINNYVFVGSNDEGSRVLISVLDNDIQGVIETEGKVFAIKTVGNNQYALIAVGHSLRETCTFLYEENNFLRSSNVKNYKHDFDIEGDDDITSSPIHKAVSTYDCKIRVLVLYTQNAQSYVSNIKNTILTAVALTNQSFVNSQIDCRIELVYAGQTNYTESGYITDLSRFINRTDGYMDEVHTLRNKYSADACVLLTNDSVRGGVSPGVGVTEYYAYCVVSVCNDWATSYYSFGHEIGHLLGCTHDLLAEDHSSPFAYGHGYVAPSYTWRTIMAYSNSCNNCPRIQYWSNPNVTYNGEAMGTVTANDNARVWNERSNTVMAFRQPDDNVILTSGDMQNTLYADIIAKQNIATSGTVNTLTGNTLNMRAGNSILLQPGFAVQAGAEFSAKIENVDDCEECALNNQKKR